MKKILLSVVIPVHRIDDRSTQLELIIKSISNLPIQLVVVQDNYFTDFNLFEEISGIDSEQICVVSGKFGNPGAARNFGLKYTSGDWTAFWDSDDFPRIPEFVKMVTYAGTREANIVAGFFDKAEKTITTQMFYRKFSKIFLRLQISLNPGLWRFAFKTNSIESMEFPELVMGEDQIFLINRIKKISDICCYSGVVYQYSTDSPNQVTRQTYNRSRLGEAFRYIAINRLQNNSWFSRFLVIKLAFSYFKISPRISTLRLIGNALFTHK